MERFKKLLPGIAQIKPLAVDDEVICWEAYDEAMLELREIEPVLELMRRCDGVWHDKEIEFWVLRLAEEYLELTETLTGEHDDHPHWELMQIAAIALNCLRLFSTNTVMRGLLEEQLKKGRYQSKEVEDEH